MTIFFWLMMMNLTNKKDRTFLMMWFRSFLALSFSALMFFGTQFFIHYFISGLVS